MCVGGGGGHLQGANYNKSSGLSCSVWISDVFVCIVLCTWYLYKIGHVQDHVI